MNFLAHTFLSGPSLEIRIGNILGEFVKGNIDHDRNSRYSDQIKVGIRLHRSIDEFTDQHPLVRMALLELRKTQGKFAGIALDILFDHFLAIKFDHFSNVSLVTFAADFYLKLNANLVQLPKETWPMVNSMTTRNWFLLYKSKEGMEWVYKGMANRLNVPNDLSKMMDLDNDQFSFFEKQFELFFPLLQTHCSNKITTLGNNSPTN